MITTATDVNQVTSFDLLAQEMNATFTDFRATVKTLNQMMVSGDRIGIWWHPDMAAEQDKYALRGLSRGGSAHSAGTGCAGVRQLPPRGSDAAGAGI